MENELQITCRVCMTSLVPSLSVLCPICETPHHKDCWEYNGRCSVYACQGGAPPPPPPPTNLERLTASFDTLFLWWIRWVGIFLVTLGAFIVAGICGLLVLLPFIK